MVVCSALHMFKVDLFCFHFLGCLSLVASVKVFAQKTSVNIRHIATINELLLPILRKSRDFPGFPSVMFKAFPEASL